MIKLLRKLHFLLKEDGAISELIRTADGFEIVQRVGKKTQTFKPLANVSKDIKDTFARKSLQNSLHLMCAAL